MSINSKPTLTGRWYDLVGYLVGTTLLTATSMAQSSTTLPPIVPDRPGFYCGSATVQQGVLQFEAGMSYDHFGQDGLSSRITSTPVVARLGVLPGLEFRIGVPGVVYTREDFGGPSTSETDISSPSLGVKWQFSQQESHKPSQGLLFVLGLPVGSESQRPEKLVPTLAYLMDWGITDRLALSTNLGLNLPWDAATEGTFTQPFAALALAYSLTPTIGSFVELYGVQPDAPQGSLDLLVDGGFTFRAANDLQFDVSLTRGLGDASTDWILAGGISFRFYGR